MRPPSTRHAGNRTVRGLAVLVAAGLALAGCGSSGEKDGGSASGDKSASASPSATASSAAPTTAPPTTAAPPPPPPCKKVWVEGKRLPINYAGCSRGGKVVAATGANCESGQRLYIYAKHYFAVPEGKIYRAAHLNADPDYKQIRRSCSG